MCTQCQPGLQVEPPISNRSSLDAESLRAGREQRSRRKKKKLELGFRSPRAFPDPRPHVTCLGLTQRPPFPAPGRSALRTSPVCQSKGAPSYALATRHSLFSSED